MTGAYSSRDWWRRKGWGWAGAWRGVHPLGADTREVRAIQACLGARIMHITSVAHVSGGSALCCTSVGVSAQAASLAWGWRRVCVCVSVCGHVVGAVTVDQLTTYQFKTSQEYPCINQKNPSTVSRCLSHLLHPASPTSPTSSCSSSSHAPPSQNKTFRRDDLSLVARMLRKNATHARLQLCRWVWCDKHTTQHTNTHATQIHSTRPGPYQTIG